jgi:hypothetical protein
MKLSHALLLTLALAFSGAASAQWQWIDKDGRKIFSDRAPPPDIPEKNILKQPAGGRRGAAAPAPEAQVPAPAQAGAAAPAASGPRIAASGLKVSGKDKDLMEKKKAADDAEAAKRKEAEEKLARDKADNCQRAKRSLENLNSGARMQQLNAKGEREIMDDAQRAAEGKRLQSIVDSDCNARK